MTEKYGLSAPWVGLADHKAELICKVSELISNYILPWGESFTVSPHPQG